MSLTWRAEWLALSRRIVGILEAGRFYVRCLTPEGRDPQNVGRELLRNSQDLFRNLTIFLERYRSLIPVHASSSLEGFIQRAVGYFQSDADKVNNPALTVQFRLTGLASLHGELAYYLSDFEANGRRLSERAFIHLQRSIVVDSDLAKRWQTAYSEREEECEKLGAVHLLAHGIWAFKTNAMGGRTDLILGDQLIDSEVERVADALVLTEWKKISDSKDLQEKAQQAYRQACLYATGMLAGVELSTCRYLVLVSEHMLEMPLERQEEGVRYKFINIAVRPLQPSQSSRRGL